MTLKCPLECLYDCEPSSKGEIWDNSYYVVSATAGRGVSGHFQRPRSNIIYHCRNLGRNLGPAGPHLPRFVSRVQDSFLILSSPLQEQTPT